MQALQFMLVWTVSLSPLFMSGCASTQYYKTSELSTQFSNTLTEVNSQMAKYESDLEEKTSVYDFVTQQNNPSTLNAVPELTSNLKAMKAAMAEIKAKQAKLSEINGQLAAFSYKQDKIYSTDDQWKPIDKLVKDFKSITDEINLDVDQYSKASADFATTVSDNKLYHAIKTTQVDEKFANSISNAQKVLGNMTDTLKVNKATYDDIMDTSVAGEAVPHKPLKDQLDIQSEQRNEVQSLIQRLNEQRNRLIKKYQTKTVIKSSDPNWADFIQLRSDYKATVDKIRQANEKFKKAGERFSNLSQTVN